MAIYILFAKEWKSLSQMFMIIKVYFDGNALAYLFCYIRSFLITMNELVILAVTCCTNIGEDRLIGLTVNFSAALIICELDDIIMSTGLIH